MLTPMLASAGPLPTSPSAWAFEPKLDGWRVQVYVADGVDIRTRSGRAIASCVPELEGLVAALDHRPVILDGELIAGQGLPQDFYRLGPRLAATRPLAARRWRSSVPLSFVAFDLLHLDGHDLRCEPYDRRRHLLESLSFSDRSWCTVASYRCDGSDLLAACADLELEGIVAKRVQSPYRSGERSRHWIKVKTPAWREHHGPLRNEHHRDDLQQSPVVPEVG
ncbi:MAG: hypothetical protein KY447_05730 [Actinobacteria bacterium]|nr:hypothetical protein [Actinomycetota bacterium]